MLQIQSAVDAVDLCAILPISIDFATAQLVWVHLHAPCLQFALGAVAALFLTLRLAPSLADLAHGAGSGGHRVEPFGVGETCSSHDMNLLLGSYGRLRR